MITQQELDELKAAEEKAIAPPWTVGGSGTVILDWENDKAWGDSIIAKADPMEREPGRLNSEFIALSRNLVPKLIEEVERLRSGYLTDEHGNEYVQVCFLKEKIRELSTALEKAREALSNCIEVAGRKTREFDAAREALRSIEGVLK